MPLVQDLHCLMPEKKEIKDKCVVLYLPLSPLNFFYLPFRTPAPSSDADAV